jgi:5-histidylcysteine sulfoxide synthase
MDSSEIAIKKKKSVNPVSLASPVKEEVLKYFIDTWELYEKLFKAINRAESYYKSPDSLRNPLIFYYGHTAAFYINKLVRSGLIESGINPHYEIIFAKGVDPDLPENLSVEDSWPSVNEVKEYRKTVYNLIINLIEESYFNEPITAKNPLWALMMGIEHDRIHFETSSVLIRQLEVDLLSRPLDWHYSPINGKTPDTEWVNVPKGKVVLGKTKNSKIFGWDNEFGSLEVDVNAFTATKNLVSNEDYAEFVETGYNDMTYWSEEGWNWKETNFSCHPKFWIKTNNGYQYRAMFDEMDLPMNWPVEVNAHEALAYCKWKGNDIRLMNEAEFNLIANTNESLEPFERDDVNINMRFGSPNPVGYFENEQNRFNDLYGNIWDWLNDSFYPLQGFESHELYKDFSEPYFGDEHNMLLGGSWATTGTGASRYYRLWFRRNFYQHAGFRLAKSI